jgi:peptide/nickel transport system permease protein
MSTRRYGRRGAALNLARRFPLGAVGAVIMVVFVGAAVFADVVAPFSPLSTNPALSLAAARAVHPFAQM